MMLNRIRGLLTRPIKPIAASIARSNIDPNSVTLVGMLVSLLAPLASAYYSFPGLLIIILASSMFDALDGEIARISGRSSKAGAFLDSLCDRASDLSYIASFLLLGVEPIIVYIAAGASLMVSYIRARAESLGIKISGVGIMERSERILALALITLAGAIDRGVVEPAMAVFTALTMYTVIERAIYVLKSLSRGYPR
jgi:archaetidylinositol phosphate synthase